MSPETWLSALLANKPQRWEVGRTPRATSFHFCDQCVCARGGASLAYGERRSHLCAATVFAYSESRRSHSCVATVYTRPDGHSLRAIHGCPSRVTLTFATPSRSYGSAFRAYNTPAKTRDCQTPAGHRWAASQCAARQRPVRTALAKRWPTAPLSELCLSLWCAREAPCHDHRCPPARE